MLRPWDLIFFPELESTNDWALAALHSLAPDRPCLVLAQKQVRGRGRGTRTWQAPAGNLTCSFVFSLENADEQGRRHAGATLTWQTRLAFATGLALLETATGYLPANSSAQLKWPNDLLLAGRKTAGILIETSPQPKFGERPAQLVVIGIGLNVNSAPSNTELKDQRWNLNPPTALASEHGQPIELTDALLNLSANLAGWLGSTGLLALASDQPSLQPVADRELIQRYESRLAWRGEQVTLHRGTSAVTGKLIGLDGAGHLLIQAPDETLCAAASGELRLAR